MCGYTCVIRIISFSKVYVLFGFIFSFIFLSVCWRINVFISQHCKFLTKIDKRLKTENSVTEEGGDKLRIQKVW